MLDVLRLTVREGQCLHVQLLCWFGDLDRQSRFNSWLTVLWYKMTGSDFLMD